MQQLKFLEKYRGKLRNCMLCDICRFDLETMRDVCLADIKFFWRCYTAGGKVEIARHLLDGRIQWTPKMVEIIYSCTLCGACSAQCYMKNEEDPVPKESRGGVVYGFDPYPILEDLRRQAVADGVGPLPAHKVYGESVVKNYNPYREPHEKRLEWLDGEVPAKGETVYFVGCTSSYRQKVIARATVSVLRKLKVNFALLGLEEWCCGSPLLRTGQLENAAETIRHNVEALKKAGAKRVVTSCAGCFRSLKEDYAQTYGKLDFEVLHVTEFLNYALKKTQKNISKFDKTITYHDPCHLGRHMGFYETPRELLNLIPGIRLVEMRRNRSAAWCCGAGGGFRAQFPEISIEVAVDRIREAEETNVEAIVSSCPFCWRNLSDAIKTSGSKLELYDVVELVDKALKT